MITFPTKVFSILTQNSYLKIALIVLALAVFALAAHTALAQAAPAAAGAAKGTALAGIANVAVTAASAGLVIFIALFILQMFLNAMLAFAGTLLDLFFNWNLILVPNNMTVVPLVWGYMRDIVNAFFILIILWIAFTIIFNLESWGGKKLLIRVVGVALLINFSLVLVSALFGLANQLALPFRNAMNEGRISDFIAAKSKIHEIATTVDVSSVAEIENAARSAESELIALEKQQVPSSLNASRIANYFGKPEEVQAQGAIGIIIKGARLGIGALASSRAVATASKMKGGLKWAGAQWKKIPEWAKVTGALALVGAEVTNYKLMFNLALQDFFLFLILAAVFPIVIILGLRIIMMIFLGILAPIAMLLYVMPGKFGQQYWNMWLSSLLNWAFLAPAFYLLLYISLLVLNQLNDGLGRLSTDVRGFSENLANLVAFMTFLVFLYASVFVARKMAGVAGETAIGWGKAALGLALSGAGVLAARGATKALAQPRVREGIERLGQMPGIRAVGGLVPARARERFLEAERKKVEEHKKDAELASKHIAINELATLSPHRKVAFLERVAQEGWMNDAIQAHGEDKIRRWLEMSAQYGKQKQILPSALQLLTNENAALLVPGAQNADQAETQILEKFKSDDWARLNKNAIQNPDGSFKVNILRKIAEQVEPENLRRIGRENREFRDAINEALERHPDTIAQLKPQTYDYILSNAGQQLGYTVPEQHHIPMEVQRRKGGEIVIEETRLRARIEDLGRRAQRLEQLAADDEAAAQGMAAGTAEYKQRMADAARQRAEARRLQQVDIEELRQRIERLYGPRP